MCSHPAEERQRVFEGTVLPRADRMLCGLCGELVYLAPPGPHPRAEPDRALMVRRAEPVAAS